MNNLDPTHINSSPLKVFIHKNTFQNSEMDTIEKIDSVICEILKYQKGKKRPLPSEESISQVPPSKKVCLSKEVEDSATLNTQEKKETPNKPPPKKKVCLTTISNKVPAKKESKDAGDEAISETNDNQKTINNLENKEN